MSTALFRGEGGAEFEMDLPLSPHMQEQLKAGKLTRVSEVTEAEVAGQAAELAAAESDDEDDDVPPELKAFLDTPPEAPAPKPAKAKAK